MVDLDDESGGGEQIADVRDARAVGPGPQGRRDLRSGTGSGGHRLRRRAVGTRWLTDADRELYGRGDKLTARFGQPDVHSPVDGDPERIEFEAADRQHARPHLRGRWR